MKLMRRLAPTGMALAVSAAALVGCVSEPDVVGPPTAGRTPTVATDMTEREELKTASDFQTEARRHRVVIETPTFVTDPGEMKAWVDRELAAADAHLNRIARQNKDAASFQSTIAALDHALYPVVCVSSKLSLTKETNPDETVRSAATEQYSRVQQWYVGVTYREDVYKALKAFEDAYSEGQRPRLRGEELKLLKDTMRDYRRAGLHLDQETRARVEAMQKELASLSTTFGRNVTDASETLHFTTDDLKGAPENFLTRTRRDDGRHAVRVHVNTDFIAVMQNVSNEETRRRVKTARYSLGKEVNTPIIQEMVQLRGEIGAALGYNSWNDYQTETRMAESGERAMTFVTDLIEGMEPKFREEIEQMRRMKAEDTGDSNAQIHVWDWRYYENQIKKRGYQVDAEALRVFFPYEQALTGMFEIYEEIFRLNFEQIEAPWVWHEDVKLYIASDSETGEPMGLFYLDMFPREGKYGHFAQFGIIPGKRLEDGNYRRPVVSLVCNFTAPEGDKPSLLTHREVVTLFHEFGHALHSILTRAEFMKFSGTRVPRDFVEAPSQMLEKWVWDADVLNRFAADYRDPSRKIDPAVLEQMNEARLATAGLHYRRQMSFALADLRLHDAGATRDVNQVVNDTLAEVFLPSPEGTTFATHFGHLTSYDAGYYGYAWAEAIAADMATIFEQAPGGLMDQEAGMRLRKLIYAPGGSIDANEMVRNFLGREQTIEPFLNEIGVRRATLRD
ncbi:MAG: hypothetical protein EA376_06830 [Phycisphaeraceae bacterium]|nr:MAG: hypothetical protein EA376_06830 [Phycisphaeraceae bacterium]